MKKSNKGILIRAATNMRGLVLGILIGILWISGCDSKVVPACNKDSMAFFGENPITLQASFIGCACGLDYPQYHVDSVLSSENVPADYYLNKEISLQYKDAALEKSLALPDCATGCYHYLLSGNMEHNGYGMHRLTVSDGQVVLDSACCADQR
jgi:hypothetical protein